MREERFMNWDTRESGCEADLDRLPQPSFQALCAALFYRQQGTNT